MACDPDDVGQASFSRDIEDATNANYSDQFKMKTRLIEKEKRC
jgi:hypothetical protein